MPESQTLRFDLLDYKYPEGHVPNERLTTDLNTAVNEGHSAMLFGPGDVCILIGEPKKKDVLFNWVVNGDPRQFATPEAAVEYFQQSYRPLDGFFVN